VNEAAEAAVEAVQNTELQLSPVYDRRRLSELLQRDALDARSIPGATDLVYQLDDFARHAEQLEAALELAQDALKAAEEAVEELTEQVKDLEDLSPESVYQEELDQSARDEVERELHIAGIIEDPDVDGGLTG